MTMHVTGGPPLIVVMGVSGCGKSAVGVALAQQIGVHFVDGDTLHPASNIEKMSRGLALRDIDRLPWLADVGRTLSDFSDRGLVMACSALKRSYRDVIRWEAPSVVFVHLHGKQPILHSRLSNREGHFMPAHLLASQLEALECLDLSENGFMIDIESPVDAIVSRTVEALLLPEGSVCSIRN